MFPFRLTVNVIACVILLASPVTERVPFNPYTPAVTSVNCTTGFSTSSSGSSSGVSIGVGVGVSVGRGVGVPSSNDVIFKLSSNS